MAEMTAPTPATPIALTKVILMAKNKLLEARPIRLVKMAPAIPIPRTMPTFRAVAKMAEAIPCLSRGALPIKALVLGEMKIPVPSPVTARLIRI